MVWHKKRRPGEPDRLGRQARYYLVGAVVETGAAGFPEFFLLFLLCFTWCFFTPAAGVEPSANTKPEVTAMKLKAKTAIKIFFIFILQGRVGWSHLRPGLRRSGGP